MLAVLDYDFMRRALLAALMVGTVAPLVGVFVVQRRLSLIGDGIGHVALAGVAVGLITGSSPTWVALVAAVLAAVALELVRASGRTSGDLALAMLFYAGIAAGVVLVSLSPDGSAANLVAYLFGSITTTTSADLALFAGLAVLVVVSVALLGRALYAVSDDEEFARASGLPVLAVNLVLAVLVAATVVLSMRVVGLLLISALMVVPVALAQLVARSFAQTVVVACATGLVASLLGTTLSFYADTPSGGTIVLLAVGAFAVTALATLGTGRARALRHRRRHGLPEQHGDHVHHGEHVHGEDGCEHPVVAHHDHVDYVHDGHRHSPRLTRHGVGYDEH
ncbi:metal ABC transporter permease [Aquipuribacter hungaricus]|uniref:Metal ABC transporter permease n=1 Tax=Aquipuribacter hungaricus TaxID=545624 RepID=A0ABV7WG43_9MICO